MKRSPFLKTWLALAVLGGLSAYIFLVENKKPAGGDAKPKQKLFSQDAAKAKQIRLEPRGGEAVVVEKHDKAWSLTAPLAAPADAGAAEALLNAITGLELDEVVAESGAKLGEFGLEPPQRSVSVSFESGAPLSLLLGNKTADGSSLYAKTPDSPRVFTLPGQVESSLSKSAFDLRDRDLLHVKRDAVKQLAVAGPGGESYALARGEDGEWAITKPLATRAGRWAVDGLLGTLEGLRMDKIAAEAATAAELSKLGFDKPARSVTLTLADGSTRELQIGSSPESGRYHARVAGSSLVAVIPGALVDDLAKGMGELRMKRVADVATFDVQGFDVAADGKKWSYAKSTEKDKDGFETAKWKRTAPDARELDRTKVEDALFKLAGLEVQEFVDAPKPPAAYGLDAPTLSVTIRLTAGKPPVSLEIGEKDGGAFSRRPGDAAVLKLDAAKVAEAKKELLGL